MTQINAIGVPRPCGTCGSFLRYTRREGPHLGEYCNTCRRFMRWVPKEMTLERALAFVMPFGKNKGKKLSDMSDEDLAWLHENCERPTIAAMAKLVYESRGDEN